MIRRILLTAWLGSMLAGSAALAQNPSHPGQPAEVSPEIFPTVTPLPPKPPLPSELPSQSPEPTPLPTVTPTALPTVRPTATPQPSPRPTPKPTPRPTALPQGKTELAYVMPELTEGQRVTVQLQIKGNVSFPVKGTIRFSDSTYDYSKTVSETVPFVLEDGDVHAVSVLFRSPGRKQIVIDTANKAAPARHVLAFVQPFAATVFPLPVSQDLSPDPSLWRVYVNLQHSLSPAAPQRQYYMVTYKGEVVQKLLTSSATPGKLTPEGTFVLGAKIASPKSTLYESVMPFWTTILIPGHSAEYGNHGLVGEDYLYHLGVPASHGCLRLSNKWIQQSGQWLNIGGAKWVYSHVPVGTTIKIFKRTVQPFAFQNYSMWQANKR